MEDTDQKKEYILLIDDEKIILKQLRRAVNSLGYSTLEAMGGTEAIELFKENLNNIKMVLTDQSMPQMSGIELSEKISALKPSIPIVLISGNRYDLEELNKHGICDQLKKPFSSDQLKEEIEKYY